MLDGNRVLSLQSHVVHGYVGNKAATFPLQLLGFDVDPLNSVNLSTHNAYKTVKGIVMEKKDIDLLFNGLHENGLLGMYSHVLTGYIGSVTFLEKITDIVQTLRVLQARRTARSSNTNKNDTSSSHEAAAITSACPPFYVCDPVLGDEGRFYVSPDLIPIYRAKILPLATILTPNQFEAEVLTDTKITDISSACESMHKLHAMGVRTVIITSSSLTGADLGPSECCDTSVDHSDTPCSAPGNKDGTVATAASLCSRNSMLLLASCPVSDVEDQITDPNGLFHDLASIPEGKRPAYVQFAIPVPKITDDTGNLISFTGTGDMTAALLLAQSTKYPNNLVKATELVLRTIHAVCLRTATAFKKHHRKLDAARDIISREIGRKAADSEKIVEGVSSSHNVPVIDSDATHSSISVETANNEENHVDSDAPMTLDEAKLYLEFTRGIVTKEDTYVSRSSDAFTDTHTYKDVVEALSKNTLPVPSFLELKLVQSKADIESPPDFGFRAVRVHCETN